MRRAAAALACVGWLLAAAGAGAETWRLLDGTLTDSATGRRTTLTGSFDAHAFGGGGAELPGVVLLVDDFALRAGRRTFTPREPIEYYGLAPSPFATLADQIHVDGAAVGFVRLHAGGILDADDEQVTFRTFELRSGTTTGGQAAGELGDGPLPRRLELEGVVTQVDQSFLLPGECEPPTIPLPPPDPPDHEGVVIESNLFFEFEVFEISGDQTVAFVPPVGGGLIDRVVGDHPSQIGGDLEEGGDVVILNPAGLYFGPVGLYMPSYPMVTVVPTPDEPPGSGNVPNRLPTRLPDLPPTTLGFPMLCNRLTPLPREESQIGTFALVATAAQPVEIDVLPGLRRARVKPGSRDRLPVALLGAPDLDVRDVVPSSLRLGPGEAAPTGRAHRTRVNRDRKPDLLVPFRTRDAEVAFGDTRLCLHGETADGTQIEGCDAIDTLPRRRRAR